LLNFVTTVVVLLSGFDAIC